MCTFSCEAVNEGSSRTVNPNLRLLCCSARGNVIFLFGWKSRILVATAYSYQKLLFLCHILEAWQASSIPKGGIRIYFPLVESDRIAFVFRKTCSNGILQYGDPAAQITRYTIFHFYPQILIRQYIRSIFDLAYPRTY